MASFTLTVNIPASDTRAIELNWVDQALRKAAQDSRSQGGVATSGNILVDSAQNIGSWTYTPTAAK
jgi:hypothetical protein